MSRREDAIVAWPEVPGRAPSQKNRPVGYGVILADVRTESIENVFGADMSGLAKQWERYPNAWTASQIMSISVSRLLQETVHSASSSSNKIGPLKKGI